MIRFHVSNNQNHFAIYGRQVMYVTHNTGHIMTFIITRILLVHYIVGYHIIHIHSVQHCEYDVCVQLMVHALASPIM